MHLTIALFVIAVAWKWGNWRQWQRYHTVMLYMAVCNLTYSLLCSRHYLWKMVPDGWTGDKLTEIVYTFVTFPGTVLLFLTHYPDARRWHGQLLYLVKWVLVYAIFELVLLCTDKIDYRYGWSIGWSVLFDCIMFPMLRLFYVRPLIAYAISAGICAFLLRLFDIPMQMPLAFFR